MGGTNPAKILMISIMDTYHKLSVEIDHCIKTGFGLVLLDKNKHVLSVIYGFDHCDLPIFNKNKMNKKVKYKNEICDEALNRLFKRKHNLFDNVKYGEIHYGSKGATIPSLNGRKYYLPIFAHTIYIMYNLGYKHLYTTRTNPTTIQWSTKGSKDLYYLFDFLNYKFKDGTIINQKYFETLKQIYGIIDISNWKKFTFVLAHSEPILSSDWRENQRLISKL
eukprot:297376_1